MKHFVDSTEDPMSEVLSDFKGDRVLVRLKDGHIIQGILQSYDGDYYYMEEYLQLGFHRDEVVSLTVIDELS